MKYTYVLLLCAATLMGVSGCGSRETNELAHHHDHSGHNHDHHGHNHEAHNHEESAGEEAHAEGIDVIEVEPEIAERFGVEVDTVKVQPFGRVVKVSGQIVASAEGNIVVAAPTSGILSLIGGINIGSEVKAGSLIGSIKSTGVAGGDVNKAAKVELDAARAEFERIEPLYADRLVTLAQYNAAKAAYERAKAAYSAPAATGRATASISGVITSLDAKSGQYVEVGTTIATISASNRLTLRADMPSKYYSILNEITDARIAVPYSGVTIDLNSLDGRRLNGTEASAGASGGYIPVVFSFRNDGTLLPGTAVEVYLIGTSDRKALTVPRSAITEQQGDYFVYVRLDEDCYRKMPVVIGGSDGINVEITSGLKGGELVVVQGVTTIRLAAASGTIPEGHSHSH